jgi:hypothetical protein
MPPKDDSKPADNAEKANKKTVPAEDLFPNFFPDFDDILPPGFDPMQRDRIRKELEEMRNKMRKQLEEMRKAFLEGGAFPKRFERGFGGFLGMGGSRLGTRLDRPDASLVDQLDLPKGQGLVILDVEEGSAAAKAGLKPHDILLEVDGKPVPDDVRQFARTIADLKADTPLDVVVLRKGKKETIKGLRLPEEKESREPFNKFNKILPIFPGRPLPIPPAIPGVGGKVVQSSFSRSGDQFNINHVEDGVEYSIKGTIADGKSAVGEVTITEPGKEKQSFDGLDKVPEAHRERVRQLAENAAGTSLRFAR